MPKYTKEILVWFEQLELRKKSCKLAKERITKIIESYHADIEILKDGFRLEDAQIAECKKKEEAAMKEWNYGKE